MAMICHQPATSPIAVTHIKELPHSVIDDSLRRIEKLKKKLSAPLKFTTELWDSIDADIMKHRIDVLGEKRAHQKVDYSGENRSPVEDY